MKLGQFSIDNWIEFAQNLGFQGGLMWFFQRLRSTYLELIDRTVFSSFESTYKIIPHGA